MENDTQQQQNPSNGGGLKLMTVFIVVLALHVLVIGGVSAYSLLKGTSDPVATDVTKENKTDAPSVTPSTETPAVDAAVAPVMADQKANEISAPVSPLANPEGTPAVEPIIAAPQHATITAPPAPAPIVELAPAPVIASGGSYTVAKGDTLSKIARIHGMKVADLKSMNALKSDNLKIGQELKVKGGSATVAAASEAPSVKAVSATSAPAKAHTTSTAEYVVGKGDTLTKIAKQYNTTASAIMAVNKLSDARKLKIGMKLVIPGQARQQMTEQQVPPSTLEKPVSTSADFAMAK